ncbi:JAB domain-containing protein [Pedobacter sp. WC2501]|uniref:JAB domain-containing protein n=1 Tax=Pedobacter sp. WC2501 TaxID=3461400 RepID=UPI0040457F39
MSTETISKSKNQINPQKGWITIEDLTYKIKEIQGRKKIKDADDAYFEILENWDKANIATVRGYQALVLNEEDRITHRIFFDTKKKLRPTDFDTVFDVLSQVHATKVIVGQNNPHKQVLPTNQEELIARRFRKLGEDKNIVVKDQLIVSKVEFFSFKDNGL